MILNVQQKVQAQVADAIRAKFGLADVPPFAVVDWQHTVRAVNVVGLKRAGFDEKRIREIRQAFRVLFRSGRNLALAVKEVEKGGRANSDVLALLEFITSSKRGVCFGAD